MITFCAVFFAFGCLLTVEGARERTDKVRDDAEEKTIMKAWLCTGNRDWYKKVKNVKIRAACQIGILIHCDFKVEDFKKLLADGMEGMKEDARVLNTLGISDCFWNEWDKLQKMYFCPRDDPTYRKHLDHYVALAIESYICSAEESTLICRTVRTIAAAMPAIRAVIGPKVCPSRRSRRQYDTSSFVNWMNQVACEHHWNHVDTLIMEGDEANTHHVLFSGFGCCFFN